MTLMLPCVVWSIDIKSDNPETKLNWIRDPSANLCGGYFFEPLLPKPSQARGTIVTSESVTGILGEKVHLLGKVKIYKDAKLLKADRADLYKDPKAKQIKKIVLSGHISFQQKDQFLLGEKAIFWNQLSQGVLEQAWYRFYRGKLGTVASTPQRQPLNYWGKAKKIDYLSQNYYRLHDASYAVCPPAHAFWKIEAKQLDLDRQEGLAYGKQTILKIKNIPVFYWPYFRYPIDHRRRTGFLLPVYSHSKSSGRDFAWPFYLNLAPNYDATITSHYLSLRGSLIELESRYLAKNATASLKMAYLPHDSEFLDYQRDLSDQSIAVRRWNHQRLGGRFQTKIQLGSDWQAMIDYQDVSDDYFYRDLSSVLLAGFPRHLMQNIALSYQAIALDASDFFQTTSAKLSFKKIRTLHPHDETAVPDQYGVLPNLLLQQALRWQGFEMDLNLQATEFRWPQHALVSRVNGRRVILMPSLRYVYRPTYGFFIPSVSGRFSYYRLQDPNRFLDLALHTVSDHPLLRVGYTTIDAGLYFDKELSPRYRQILTPRVMYVFIPYKNQSELPLFDTGLRQFSTNYLWQANRFSGQDRLGDTQHVTYGLSSKWWDQVLSQPILTVALGQHYYFKHRRLAFCYGPHCTAEGYLSRRTKTSPFISELTLRWSDNFATEVHYAWYHSPRYADATLFYQKGSDQQINLSYQYAKKTVMLDQRDQYHFQKTQSLNIASVWPVAKHWHALGGWRYNLREEHARAYFFGTEYNDCCWAIRVLGGRKLRYLDVAQKAHFDQTIYIQLLIKGLSVFGSNPGALMGGALPGYKNLFSEKI